jgi:hypothetical protein
MTMPRRFESAVEAQILLAQERGRPSPERSGSWTG